jgi:transcriptional regulator with XRE-family HTH domain
MAKKVKGARQNQNRPSLIGDPIIAANIKCALEEIGITPAELARRLKLTPQAVSQWLQAQTTPGARRLRHIATELKVSIESLRQAPRTPQALAQPPPKPVAQPLNRDRTVSLRAYCPGGRSDASTLPGQWSLPAEWFQGLASDQADLLVMRVTGSDLIPDFAPGELVIVDRNWHVVSVAGFYLTGNRSFPVLRRCEVVAGLEARVRIYEHGEEREMPADDLSIFGRVICKWLLPQ